MLETIIDTPGHHAIFSINTILPFAISLEKDGKPRMFDVIIRGLRYAQTIRLEHGRYTGTLFEESSSPSLNRAIVLLSPYRNQYAWVEHEVVRWATAVLAIPYTEEVGRSVVDATLQIASFNSLRPHIHIGVWALFKNRPSLPHTFYGRSLGTEPEVIGHVRGLGDLEILKSYFLLVWSEWDRISYGGLDMMEMSIREDFCGTGMARHRQDLAHRLDHILGELGRGPGYFRQYSGWDGDLNREIYTRKKHYGKLKDVLLEEEAAERSPTCASPRLTLFSQ